MSTWSKTACLLLLKYGQLQYRDKCAEYWPPVSTTTISVPVPTTTSFPITTVTTTTAPVLTTTTTTTTTSSYSPLPTSVSVGSTILVLGRNTEDITGATTGLLGYGISWQPLIVPQAGIVLPALTSGSAANFGGIIVIGQLAYDFGGGNYQSALTTAQWQQLYDYQTTYGIRMVQWDVYPGAQYGATALGGCCGNGQEQLISFSNTSAFSQAGLQTGATMSTSGLYHYPAQISDPSTTWEIARFAPNAQFNAPSTAAVLNRFADGRQQMVFFIGFAWWSDTSVVMQHAWIAYLTKGLYAGYRRVNLNTQIDDIFLETDLYYPKGAVYRVTPDDLTSIAGWLPKIRAKMSTGSAFYPEFAHNGNGNIQGAVDASTTGAAACGIGPVYTDDRADTTLEFQKPLGTGTDAWPAGVERYAYTTRCLNLDPLKRWFSINSNRDSFMHISHTFTHYELNNATYDDALREIQFNQAWLQQSGLAAGRFSKDSLVPPAITGLHNGDVLRAWSDAGLTNAVGDNTRPVLRNTDNPMHPYITTLEANGYAGFTVVPRWATRIYYNCDTPECDLQEWKDISAGTGDFNNLLRTDLADVTRHLFGLYHDGYMFHQANLRTKGLANNLSIYQQWVETVVNEFTRLVNWPIITLSQTDLAQSFTDRMTRDSCGYKLSWQQTQINTPLGSRASVITGFTVTSDNDNSCDADIPITVPVNVALLQGARSEKIGNDPLTLWVKMRGKALTYKLSTPIAI